MGLIAHANAGLNDVEQLIRDGAYEAADTELWKVASDLEGVEQVVKVMAKR